MTKTVVLLVVRYEAGFNCLLATGISFKKLGAALSKSYIFCATLAI